MTPTSDEKLLEEAIQERVSILQVNQEADRRIAEQQDEPLVLVDVNRMVTNLEPTTYLVEDYLELGTVGMLCGKYQTGKSFVALDWACCVSTGSEWFGHEVETGNVLYVAAEGASGQKKRAAAWIQENHQAIEKEALQFLLKPVQFASPRQIERLGELIVEQEIDLLIVDTLARSTTGLSENDAMDMNLFINGCFKLRDARGTQKTTVLVVHHLGKDEKRGARGHSSLVADIDFNFEVRTKGDVEGWVLECDKLKDDRHPDPWSFTLKQVELATGITSCVVINNDTGSISAARPHFEESQGIRRSATLDQSVKARKGKRKRSEAATQRLVDALDELGEGATDEQLAQHMGITRQAVNRKRLILMRNTTCNS